MARDSPRVCASCVFWVWRSSHVSVKQDPSLLRYVLYSCFHLWPHIPSASVFVCPGNFPGICFSVALWKVSHFAPLQIRTAALSKAAGRSGRKWLLECAESRVLYLTDVTVRGWNYCRKWVHNTFFVPILQKAMHSCRIIYHTYLLYRLWYTVWCTFWLCSIDIPITILIITINHHYTRYIRYLLGIHSLDSS